MSMENSQKKRPGMSGEAMGRATDSEAMGRPHMGTDSEAMQDAAGGRTQNERIGAKGSRRGWWAW